MFDVLTNPWVITVIGGLIVSSLVWLAGRWILGNSGATTNVKQKIKAAKTVIGSQTFNFYQQEHLSAESENISKEAEDRRKGPHAFADEKERAKQIKNLLSKIKQDLYSGNDKVPSVLLRALELAKILGRDEDEKWIYLELTGYSPGYTSKITVIDMRVDPYLSAKYRAADGLVRIQHGHPPTVEDLSYPQFLSMPVTEIIHRIEETKRLNSREFWIMQPLPAKAPREFRKHFPTNEIPVIYTVDQFQAVLDGIRARILKFIQEVEWPLKVKGDADCTA